MEIYNSGKENIKNTLFQIERLEEEGFDLSELSEEMFEDWRDAIELEDEEKLGELRKELNGERKPF
jgi:hypothetical protein